jgi:hypothetical protein
MADVLQSLIVKLALDGADYESGMQKASGGLNTFASTAQNVGGALSLAVTTPIVGIGLASIDAASNVNESMSKMQVVFGSSADAISAWSATSATAMGQSQGQALEAVGTFGNLFSTMGLGQAQSAQMSQGMVQLASDLSSFNNIPIDVALQKLQSGLVGQAEPLRALGVNISQAAIQQQAFSMGLAKQGDELTSAQKAQATYALIMAQTTTAQGDFVRTSDGLANSQRIVQAELANTTADLGKQLLPIALDVAKGLQGLLGWFNNLSPSTKSWITIVAGIAAAVGPVLVVLGTMISAVTTVVGALAAAGPVIAVVVGALGLLLTPVGLIVIAIGALAAAWATDFGGIREKTQAFWDWLKTSIPAALTSVQTAWSTFSNFWQSDNQTKIATIQAGWNSFTSNWQSQLSGAFNTVQGYWQSHSSAVQGIVQSQWGIISGIFQTQSNLIQGASQVALDLMKGNWSGAASDMQNTVNTLFSNLQGIFQNGLNTIRGFFDLAGFHSLGENIAQGIANGVTSGIHWITDAAQSAANAALNAAKSILGINSPSTVAAAEVGEPFTQGVGVGAVNATPAAANTIQEALNQLVNQINPPTLGLGTAGGGGGISITIYADSTTSAQTAKMGLLDGLRAAGLA